MKNNKLLDAISNISDNFIEEAAPQPAGKQAKTKRIHKLRRLLPLAAAFVVSTAVLLVPLLTSNDLPDSQPYVDPGHQTISELRGLKAYDYTYTEGDGIMADRMVFTDLYDLFSHFDYPNTENTFAIVRVLDTQRLPPSTGSIFNTDRQTADLKLLYSVGDQIPENIKIMQTLAGGCMNDEKTNLVRKGGVYVLSLVRSVDPAYKIDEYFYVPGDLDGLFEVDNAGSIHSHSAWEELNKYDGKPLTKLWKDIEYMYSHPALISSLVADIRFEYNIVRGVAGQLSSNGLYTIQVKENLFGKAAEPLLLTTDTDAPKLEPGVEYVFIYSEDHPDNMSTAARIGPDGSLDFPEGREDTAKTLEQLREQISEICEYYDFGK